MPQYPTCPECGAELCFLDRTYDNCRECEQPLPLTLKLDFDFQPLT